MYRLLRAMSEEELPEYSFNRYDVSGLIHYIYGSFYPILFWDKGFVRIHNPAPELEAVCFGIHEMTGFHQYVIAYD